MPSWFSSGFQNAYSPLMEQLIFFHDHSMTLMIIVISIIMYMLISMFSVPPINKFMIESQQLELFWTISPSLILILIGLPSIKLLYMLDEMFTPDISISCIIFLFIFSLTLSFFYLFLIHPISLVICIIIQSISLCLMIFLVYKLSWMAMMMYLIFMGGLMILFIYIAGLASNEKFSIDFYNIFLSMIFILISLIYLNMFIEHQSMIKENSNFKLFIYSIYSMNMFNPTFIIMLYLLLTLIITVNIIKLHEAPMRSLI